MAFKTKLFVGILLLILVISGAILSINRKESLYQQTQDTYKPGVVTEVDTAVRQAQLLYQQKKAQGVDFTSGPCLTNDLMPNWVVDIVHVPRTKVDDLPQNQCQAFIEGRAKHFIELDTQGNLIRVQ